jgi:hypothetical protein
VNASLERFTHAPAGGRSEMAGKDLNAILGPSGGSTFDLPATGSPLGGPPPPPAFPPPPPSFAAPPPPPAFPPPPPAFPPPLPSLAPPPAPQPFSAAAIAAAGGAVSASPAIKPASWANLPASVLGEEDLIAEADKQMPDGEATRVVPYDEQEEEEAHFRHVFDDFVDAKRSTGESLVGLTQPKFLQKLRDNKAALVSKHGCRTVRFSVYVKDGKAALKATPIRE